MLVILNAVEAGHDVRESIFAVFSTSFHLDLWEMSMGTLGRRGWGGGWVGLGESNGLPRDWAASEETGVLSTGVCEGSRRGYM